MIFSLATLKAKLILGAGILAVILAGCFYVWHLNKTVDSLKQDKIELTTQVGASNDTIKETARQQTVVTDVDKLMDQKRSDNEKQYQTKIQKVDSDVKEGKDRIVGPVLNEFFNSGL